jgi:hypothetical protein
MPVPVPKPKDRRPKIESRRGLAMLELTLALPILLFVMALIYNYGIVATWKVRENSVARLAVWQTRWPRSGATDPKPSYWFPASATMGTSDQGNVQNMDDNRVDQPVARGPLPQANVDASLLDPTRGLREGTADKTVPYPYLKKLGGYHINARNWLIDDKWQYQRMGMSDNWERRIPVIYALAEAPASLVNSYIQSVLANVREENTLQFRPLDSDPDFIYYGSLFGWGGAPDFEPRVQSMCTTDRAMTDRAVQSLIDRIQGKHGKRHNIPSVAEVMARSFLGLYERALGTFRAILRMKPPAPPPWPALAQSQIPRLQSQISAVQQALQKIQAKENSGQ